MTRGAAFGANFAGDAQVVAAVAAKAPALAAGADEAAAKIEKGKKRADGGEEPGWEAHVAIGDGAEAAHVVRG